MFLMFLALDLWKEHCAQMYTRNKIYWNFMYTFFHSCNYEEKPIYFCIKRVTNTPLIWILHGAVNPEDSLGDINPLY